MGGKQSFHRKSQPVCMGTDEFKHRQAQTVLEESWCRVVQRSQISMIPVYSASLKSLLIFFLVLLADSGASREGLLNPELLCALSVRMQ